MAQAKQLNSGTWRVLLYVGKDDKGKRIYESFTASTKAEAELKANTRKVELQRGAEVVHAPDKMTVGEAIDKYIDERSNVLAPATIRGYRTMRKLNFQNIMNLRVRQLTNSVLQKEVNREAARLSPKSIYNTLGLISPAIAEVTGGRKLTVNLPAKKKFMPTIPDDEQMQRIFAACEGQKIEIPILLCATCGLRRSEIAALDLDKDVDYKNGRVTVNKDVTYNDKGEWVVGDPKTFESSRVVEVPEWVLDKLRSARDDGYKSMNPEAITSAFRRLREKLGLENVRFYDLRHYYASLLLKLGVPDLYTMRRMGHSTTHMLKTVYQHVMSDADRAATETINAFWGNLQHDMQHEKQDAREKTRKTYKYRRKREL